MESNRVHDYCSPQHLRKPDAEILAARAAKGELALHVPSICLREGASSVRRKSQPKDADRAALYGVETKALSQAVRRNNERFPSDFMFQVTAEEMAFLRSRIVTLKA